MFQNILVKTFRFYHQFYNLQKTQPLKTFKKPLNNQSIIHKINYQLNKSTTMFEIYTIYKRNKRKMPTRNIVNVLIKILYFWKINKAQEKSLTKLDQLIKIVDQNFENLPPQVLIKIMDNFKKLDIQVIRIGIPLINKIIIQFDNTQNFELVSVDILLRLLNSLYVLLNKLGDSFNPKLIPVIKSITTYLKPSLKSSKTTILLNYFIICSDSRLINQQFLKELTLQFLSRYQARTLQNLLLVENILFSKKKLIQNLLESLKKTKAKQHHPIYRLQKYINEKFQQEIYTTKANFNSILQHLNYFKTFTSEHLKILGLSQSLNEKYFVIFKLLNNYYGQYLLESYENNIEKQKVNSWISKNSTFVGHLFQLMSGQKYQYGPLIKLKNKLINLLCQHLSQLNIDTKFAVMLTILENKYSNVQQIIKIFQKNLDQNQIKFDSMRSPRFLKIFKYKQYEFNNKYIKPIIKSIFQHSYLYDNLEEISTYLSYYAQKNINNYEQLIKIYLKISQKNRIFNKIDVQLCVKQQLKLDKIINNYKQYKNYYDQNYQIKQKIMKKIQICLKNFKIILLIHINLQTRNNWFDIKLSQLGKQLMLNFKQQFQFLNFQNLLTYKNMTMIYQIENYINEPIAQIKVINEQRKIRIKQQLRKKIQSNLANARKQTYIGLQSFIKQ